MSTRATVSVCYSENHYETVYLHYDGYPKHTGSILKEFYNDLARVQALVEGGEIRYLHQEKGRAEHFQDATPPTALGSYQSVIDFSRNAAASYVYVFEDGGWSCKEL